MRRGLVGVTTVLVVLVQGVPSEGQESPDVVVRDAELSSDVARPGGQLVARSVDPCTVPEGSPPGELFWAVWIAHDPSVDPRPLSVGYAPLMDEGAWEVRFGVPAQPGEYEFAGACMDADEAPPPGEVPGEDPADTVELIGPLYFTVVADVPRPSTPDSSVPPDDAPPAIAPPARPVAGTPNFTG
jgi:hypothetical protein